MKSLRIKNLHSLTDTGEIRFRMLNLLLGANSSGKSSFLRFFPMLRQSVETPTNSGLLLVGRYVDFGSFVDAVRGNAEDQNISFEFEIALEKDQYYYNDRVRPAEEFDTKIRISFSKRSQDNKTYVSELRLQFLEDSIEITGNEEGNVLKLLINDFDFQATKNLRLTTGRGLLPSLEIVRDEEANPAAQSTIRRSSTSPFTQALQQATTDLFHGRTQASKRLEVVRLWPLNTLSDMYKSMQNISDDSGWKKTSRKWSIEHPEFQKLRNLILADRTSALIERLDENLSLFASQTRYVAPVRASADRYMRNQEVAVDEIEPDGRNLPMFLSSLSAHMLAEFRDWTEKHLGFSVQTGGDIHLSLRLKEKGTDFEFNLADTGFGFSQILPILVQTWLLTLSKPTQRRSIRKFYHEKHRSFLIAIEQPELHLHPALQARLTRVLISAGMLAREAGIDVSFLIETHSETIVNQVGLSLCNDLLKPSDAQIIRFDRGLAVDGFPESKVQISLFSSGGILQDWPFGFFLPEETML